MTGPNALTPAGDPAAGVCHDDACALPDAPPLAARDGNPVTAPDDPALIAAVEHALAAPTGR